MEALKQDITKLKSVSKYAKSIGVSRQRVYKMIEEGKLQTIKIGDTIFIKG